MFWEQAINQEVLTDVGLRRTNNEDAASVHICQSLDEWQRSGHLFIVADGMGGHAVGELASKIAIETIPISHYKSGATTIPASLHGAVLEANKAIHTKGVQNADFLHMGTTCTTLALGPQGAVIAHVGDSRAYRVRRDRIDQLTFDHSLEWELSGGRDDIAELIDLRKHRNIITRSLGPEEKVDVDVEGPHPVFPHDVFVLCSDGLSNQVEDSEIAAIVRELSPNQSAKMLINLANARGGPDNITVVIAKVGELPANVNPTIIEEPEVDDNPLSWSYLIGCWVAAMVAVAGFWMYTIEHPIKGGITAAVGIIGLISVIIAAARSMKPPPPGESEVSKTIMGRPHRTGVALSSKQLYERLLQVDQQLVETARADHWDIDWGTHEKQLRTAVTSAKEQRFGRGVRYLAKAIDTIMLQLPRATNASPASTSK